MKGIISMLRPNEYRTHTCGELRESDIGKKVRVSGWLENVRDHGGVKFADLRDQYGLVQVVVEDEEMLDGIPKESSIMVTGTVIERDEDTINKKLDTGYIEIVAETISVLGRVRSPLPFEVASSKEIKEDLRLKYRFLDLRNREVQKAKTELDSAMDDYNIAELNLLNKLQLPFDTKLTLTDKEFTYVPTEEINLTEAIEQAKAERPEILTAENNLELQKIETHAYTAYYTSNLRQHKAAKEKLKDAELNVPQAYKDIELDVRKSYLNLIKAERALINMEKTLELAKEAARINQLLYDNGMATNLDVLEANAGLAQAEIGRYQLLVAYNISKLMFDKSNIFGSIATSPQTSESAEF
jgi:hypothetical protein